jgi:hypothetical protein
MSSLRDLRLTSLNISDTGLEYLQALTGLKQLQIDFPLIHTVNPEARAALEKSLPDCRIKYEFR